MSQKNNLTFFLREMPFYRESIEVRSSTMGAMAEICAHSPPSPHPIPQNSVTSCPPQLSSIQIIVLNDQNKPGRLTWRPSCRKIKAISKVHLGKENPQWSVINVFKYPKACIADKAGDLLCQHREQHGGQCGDDFHLIKYDQIYLVIKEDNIF